MTIRLKHMQFYGRFDARCDVAGFSLARLQAHTAEHHVHAHEHEDGHFIVVLGGRYRSSARGVDARLGPGDALWNPPGTRHSDSFEAGGAFLALSLSASVSQGLGLSDGGARRLQGRVQQGAQLLAMLPMALDLGGLLDLEDNCHQLCALTRARPGKQHARKRPSRPGCGAAWSSSSMNASSLTRLPHWRAWPACTRSPCHGHFGATTGSRPGSCSGGRCSTAQRASCARAGRLPMSLPLSGSLIRATSRACSAPSTAARPACGWPGSKRSRRLVGLARPCGA